MTSASPTEDVTQLYCPKSGGAPGEDNTTHHVIAPVKGGRWVCLYCKRTERQILDAVS